MSSSSGVGRGSAAARGGQRRRVRPRARREIRQVAADRVERRGVVVGDVVDHPAGHGDGRTAEVLLRDVLSRRLFDHRRPGGEDGALAAHHGEVADRRDQRAVSGRRPEHRGDRRYPPRAPGLGEQVGRAAAVVGTGGPKPGAFEHHHQRDLVAQCQLGHPVALGIAARCDGSGHGREVLGADHHRRSVDQTGAGDDGVGGDLAPDERADLAECARVEQPLDARAGVELALGAVLVEPLGAAHALGVRTATVEIVERLAPILGFRHSWAFFIPNVLPHGRFVARLDEQGHILDCLL